MIALFIAGCSRKPVITENMSRSLSEFMENSDSSTQTEIDDLELINLARKDVHKIVEDYDKLMVGVLLRKRYEDMTYLSDKIGLSMKSFIININQVKGAKMLSRLRDEIHGDFDTLRAHADSYVVTDSEIMDLIETGKFSGTFEEVKAEFKPLNEFVKVTNDTIYKMIDMVEGEVDLLIEELTQNEEQSKEHQRWGSGSQLVSIKEIVTGQTDFFDRELLVNGLIDVSSNFDQGYYRAQKTHYAFQVVDEEGRMIYMYGSKEFSSELREYLLQKGQANGSFKFVVLSKLYKHSDDVYAELTGYGPHVSR